MASKRKNALYKQYAHPGGFVGLPRRVFESPEYKTLNLVARCVLDELQCLHTPQRNGRIVLSVERAAKNLSKTENTVRTGFHELQKKGFIELCHEADHTKGRARQWRLTYECYMGREPTDEWRQCPHEKSKNTLKK